MKVISFQPCVVLLCHKSKSPTNVYSQLLIIWILFWKDAEISIWLFIRGRLIPMDSGSIVPIDLGYGQVFIMVSIAETLRSKHL